MALNQKDTSVAQLYMEVSGTDRCNMNIKHFCIHNEKIHSCLDIQVLWIKSGLWHWKWPHCHVGLFVCVKECFGPCICPVHFHGCGESWCLLWSSQIGWELKGKGSQDLSGASVASHAGLWCSFVGAHLQADDALTLFQLALRKISPVLLRFPKAHIHTYCSVHCSQS